MKTEVSKEITGIKMLNLLFFNYSQDMLDEMLSIREWKHCWENYMDFKEQTYMQIWELYLTKISYKTQMLLLEIARKHYGDEALRSFNNAIEMNALLEAHVKKHDGLKK